MLKAALIGTVVSVLVLSGCATPSEPTASPSKEAGFGTKPTSVCILNKALQPVDVYIGNKGQAGQTDFARDYWYWDSLNNGPRQTGMATLETGQTICTNSSESDNTLTGPVDVKVRAYVNGADGDFAYFGFNNPFFGRPAFYPRMTADDWMGNTDSGRYVYSTDEFNNYRCQAFEWNFNVLRLKDLDGMKNWKFEILGPANPEDWPEDPCQKI